MLGIQRMLLHAQRLVFPHPLTGVPVEVVAPVDAEFARALALFDSGKRAPQHEVP
jgi:tRNA pseudouridine65 synthase